MVLSMTGYGQSQIQGDDFVITVNLKAVNHRFFDLSLRLAQELQSFEPNIKQTLKHGLVRGSVSVVVSYEGTGEIPVKVNEPLASAYLKAARLLREKFNLQSELDLNSLLRLPSVVSFGATDLMPEERLKERLTPALDDALSIALTMLQEMRTAEGRQLAVDLQGRTLVIAEHVDAIESAMQSISQAYYDKLKEEVTRLTSSTNLDPARLAQEVAYLAEKCDITEEVTRLKSHTKQFLKLLEDSGEIGKKLDFLLQEMHREINTIQSKTASIVGQARVASDHAIEIKAEIERLREQVQNVV